MNYWFIRKTSLWGSKTFKKKEKGTMFIVTVFTFFIFSALAFSMIFLSQVYLRLGGFRKNSALLDYSSENGIKDGFHYLMEAMSSAPLPLVISEEKFNQLRDSTKSADTRIIEETLGIRMPVEVQEDEGEMIWRSRANCSFERFMEGGNFFSARFRLLIDSEGKLKNFLPKRTSGLETRLGILAGHVPLPLIPFLISKKLDPEQKENFEVNNNIHFAPLSNNLLCPRVSIVEEELIPQDANSLLETALKIKIFQPQDLSHARLRAVLGLENSTEPVPEGVYLIQNDLGLGGVYVQGDVEEMITAMDHGFQVIAFQMEAGHWILKFSPAQSKTYFQAPHGVQTHDLVPLGIIIVSGKIKSLGGGMVDPEGKVCPVREEEMPSILQGINLTIIASDKINLTSHLLRQGVKWQDGVPYVKDENAQLVIFSTGKDFQEDQLKEGGITIAENSPQEIKIQAALIAQGDGFEIQREKKTVHILGSLQATDYLSGDSQLEMTPLLPFANLKNSSLNSPATAEPILFLSFFEILEWKEF